jgi:nucleoid-associated protein YgaU
MAPHHDATRVFLHAGAPMPSRSRPSAPSYTVRPGDSLSVIAQNQLGDANRWRELYELNRGAISNPNTIFAGMSLHLPGSGDAGGATDTAPAAATNGPAAPAAPAAGTYVVQGGDTLSGIAARLLGDPGRYREIFEANRGVIRNPSVIHPGTVLRIPGQDGAPAPTPTPVAPVVSHPEPTAGGTSLYYVGPGDSLSRIAARLTGDGNRWRELYEANRDQVSNPSTIRVGTPLKLPAGWKAPAPGTGSGGGDRGRAPESTDPDQRQTDFRSEVYRSLARYEGGNPAAVHYDSGRVNIGKGSWTGGHIVRLMEIYEQTATENGAIETLYGYFGGKANYDAIRDRFRRHGAAGWLSESEENAFKAAGRDPMFVAAQDEKGGEDVLRYLNNIKGFSVPYPWLDGEGQINEIGAMVLCHAGHQSGSPQRAYDAVRNGRTAEQLRRAYGDESAFLQAVADLIVSWVQPKYRNGVRNRYNWLFATYGTSRKYKL